MGEDELEKWAAGLQNGFWGVIYLVKASNEQLGVQGVRLPETEPVWVQCEGYRCLAYLDREGFWRVFSNGKRLPDSVRVLDDEGFNRPRRQ